MPAAYECESTGKLIKECTECKEIYPIEEYYKHAKGVTKDGYQPRCRACTLAKYREQNARRNKKRKQKSHKLTNKHVDFIISLKGEYSTRKAARLFSEAFFAHKINPSTVHRIWKGQIHTSQTDPTKASYCEVCRITLVNSNHETQCDKCAATLAIATANAASRMAKKGMLTKVVEHVQSHPELEPMDLPFHYRKNISDAGIEVEDLFHEVGAYGGEGKDWTKDDENIVAVAYALEFTHDPAYAKKIYVGCTTVGVQTRWRRHMAGSARKKWSTGSSEYRSLMRHLRATQQFHTARVHVLHTVDGRHLKNKDDEKEVMKVAESVEQDCQLKCFLGGYELLNASFKIQSSRSSETRQFITENAHKQLDLYDVSVGYFGGRATPDGIRWEFHPAV